MRANLPAAHISIHTRGSAHSSLSSANLVLSTSKAIPMNANAFYCAVIVQTIRVWAEREKLFLPRQRCFAPPCQQRIAREDGLLLKRTSSRAVKLVNFCGFILWNMQPQISFCFVCFVVHAVGYGFLLFRRYLFRLRDDKKKQQISQWAD